jgi:MFS family permease
LQSSLEEPLAEPQPTVPWRERGGKYAFLYYSYACYILLTLTAVYLLNQVDRLMLQILLPQILKDVSITDLEAGFLTGYAFTVFYSFAGLVVGRLSDVFPRTIIIAVGVLTWSVMTILMGLARNFWQFAVLRAGLGLAQAACTPPASSLIAHYFPPERRSSAMSFYYLAIYLGAALAYSVGGFIAAKWSWRWAFVVFGVPGIGMGLIVLCTVKEPWRGKGKKKEKMQEKSLQQSSLNTAAAVDDHGNDYRLSQTDADKLSLVTPLEEPQTDAKLPLSEEEMVDDDQIAALVESNPKLPNESPTVSLKESIMYIFTSQTLLRVFVAAAIRNMGGYALGAFEATFYAHTHGLNPLQYGLFLSFVVPVGGCIGSLWGGYAGDWWCRRDRRGKALVLLVTQAIAVPLIIACLIVPDYRLSLFFLLLEYLFAETWSGNATSIALDVTPGPMRGFMTAIYFMTISLVGAGGSFGAGLIAQYWFDQSNGEPIRWALLLTVPIMYGIASLLFGFTSLSIKGDMKKCEDYVQVLNSKQLALEKAADFTESEQSPLLKKDDGERSDSLSADVH